MEAEPNHAAAIVRYLHYLKEISRKIVVREGFESVLVSGGKKKQDGVRQSWEIETHISKQHPDREIWETWFRTIDRQADKRLFAGFGLIAGRFGGRRLAAPLLFVETEILPPDDTPYLHVRTDWETLSLNYDLLSVLTGAVAAEDEFLDTGLLDKEMQFVERFEVTCEQLFPAGMPQWELIESHAHKTWGKSLEGLNETSRLFDFLQYWASQLMTEIRQLFPTCADVHTCTDAYRYDGECDSMGRKGKSPATSVFDLPARYVSAMHLFLAAVPPQLTSFAALREMVQEVQDKGFRNPTLTRLLGSALLGLPLSIEARESESDDEKLPPISLTQAQQAALRMTQGYELSYIQGPPGTGKSHTIVALMLDALARGEKVLLVSQKEAALTVVADRMETLFSAGPVPFCAYIRADRSRLREDLRARIAAGQRSEKPAQKLEQIEKRLAQILIDKSKIKEKLHEVISSLGNTLELQVKHTETASVVRKLGQQLQQRYPSLVFPEKIPQKGNWTTRYQRVTNLRKHASQAKRSRWAQQCVDKLHSELVKNWGASGEAFVQGGFSFAAEWLQVLEQREQILNDQPDNLQVDASLFELAEQLEHNLRQLQLSELALQYEKHLLAGISSTEGREPLHRFEKMLHWRRPSLVAEKMEALDFGPVLDLIPLWAVETRYIGELFPLDPGLFDLVVVDEASQVNLAEILPALYRGKRVCIVGDHSQLGIESTGVNFALRKKFDSLTWSRFRPAGLSYEAARSQQMTVTDGSILDLIRNPAHGAWIPQLMLDEHLRSHPVLAAFTARFYPSEKQPLRVMTDRADRYFHPAALVALTGGERDEDKSHPAEREYILKLMTDVQAGTHSLCRQLKEGFSIGLLSPIRSQCSALQEDIAANFTESWIEERDIMVGTPEEFQGNERDVMILSLCLDNASRYGAAHYQNARRTNVATSRARNAVVLVAGAIPDRLTDWADYARRLQDTVPEPPWPRDLPKDANDWEQLLWPIFQGLADRLGPSVKFWGRANSCGLKLAFVFSRPEKNASCCIELDGLFRLLDSADRHDRLRRAGWQVLHTPLSRWMKGADWLSAANARNSAECERLFQLLVHRLG